MGWGYGLKASSKINMTKWGREQLSGVGFQIPLLYPLTLSFNRSSTVFHSVLNCFLTCQSLHVQFLQMDKKITNTVHGSAYNVIYQLPVSAKLITSQQSGWPVRSWDEIDTRQIACCRQIRSETQALDGILSLLGPNRWHYLDKL